ncbi:hypothetical protein EV178_006410 [Coemansia sp. RSA 1646]|nr:hypothetical protein EV178_006410 [Coemansia sp. RSA 1646]
MGDIAFRLDHWGTSNVADSSPAVAGLQNLLNFYSSNCQDITQFYVNGNIVGASFAGQMIQNHAFAVVVIQKLIDEVKANGISSSKFIQYCPGDPAKSFGIILDTTGNIGALRSYVKSWSKGRCVSSSGTSSVTLNTWSVSWLGKSGNAAPDPNLPTCDYVKVVSGKDTATACGITGDAIQLYNPGVNFSLLQPGQPLCCSVGKPPDLSPKPNADGSCYSYQVVKDDSCSALAAANTITTAQIESFNKNTYGWLGCGKLQEKMNICLSSGTAPRPTPNPDAECGMLAPGDKFNSECPLKACCSSSGFCGLDDDHCKIISSPTGAPGTNGCESNCDPQYVKGDPPGKFIKVGYYESWSTSWNCMNGGLNSIDWNEYSHIHYSFADIGTDLNVLLDSNASNEFEEFKSLFNISKVLSFGGWGVSTDVATYQHLRNAMLPTNVDKTVGNLVKFTNDNGLDGLDIDWEYPSAPDIPGIPAGLPADGPNYLAFLKKLRAALPSSKTLSIAAPASYWYLKNFPIVEMSQYLDYIVYMTYDLHGQWDYNIPSVGNYLKCHTNWTETQQALTLITHAGVASNKVLLGMGAYGRSFKQTDPNCGGSTCTFTGPESGATPGKCTNTPGYISLAEINDIMANESIGPCLVMLILEGALYGQQT